MLLLLLLLARRCHGLLGLRVDNALTRNCTLVSCLSHTVNKIAMCGVVYVPAAMGCGGVGACPYVGGAAPKLVPPAPAPGLLLVPPAALPSLRAVPLASHFFSSADCSRLRHPVFSLAASSSIVSVK